MLKYLYITILTATGNFCDESNTHPPLFHRRILSHPPLKIIFRCSCSEKPIFIGLASQRTGFALNCRRCPKTAYTCCANPVCIAFYRRRCRFFFYT